MATQAKRRLKQKVEVFGFALPIVLILSIILLAIGVSTLQVGSAISRSLVDQHWGRLSKTTAQSGVSFVASCISGGTTTWPSVLAPNKKCDGTTLSPDPGIYISSDLSANASPSRWRATYTVGIPVVGSDNVPRIKITGKIEILTSASIVTKTYTWDYTAIIGSASAAPVSKKFISISAVGPHICGINTDKAVYCSGLNNQGQLGDGTTITRTSPVLFKLPVGKLALSISSARDDNNVPFSSGINVTTCVLTVDHLIYCAGNNGKGQFGDGTFLSSSTPSQFQLPAGKTATSVDSASLYDTCTVTSDQLVFCSGDNTLGQLGLGVIGSSTATPGQFGLPAGKLATSVDIQEDETTCALTADSLVYCSGNNMYGQLGIGSNTTTGTPTKFILPAGKTATAVKTGNLFTCALTTDQLMYCAGYNGNGSLGDGSTIDRSTPVQFILPAGKLVASLSLQNVSGNICALTVDQLVYCAGYNTYGGLGDGTIINRSTPVLFPLPAGKKATAVTVGGGYTCALTLDQLIYCAGYNAFGQLGDGTTVNRSVPVLFQLPAGKLAAQLVSSYQQVCALTTDQLIYCAGRNDVGQLGDGTTVNRSTPVLFSIP